MNKLKNPSEDRGIRIGAWSIFWVYSGLIVKGAVLRASEIPHFLIGINDKLIHGVEYFILFWAARYAFTRTRIQKLQHRRVEAAVLYSLFMGSFTEILQLWVPTRSCDIADFGADALGTGLAWLMSTLIIRKAK